MDEARLGEMARMLEESGAYRVLRRVGAPILPADLASTALQPSSPSALMLRPGARFAIFLDLETTGLDPKRAEVIELAMAPFLYDEAGRILEIGQPYQGFNEPSEPISPDITAITGITDDMVRGARLDLDAIKAFVEPAALVLAHNAAFDRVFAEKLHPVFEAKPWACSMCQIDWRLEGLDGRKLDYLAFRSGFFYDGHRAVNDCLAAIELLSRPLALSRKPAFAALLDKARRRTVQLYAENTSFDLKDVLKARGYRWNGDVNGRPRAWWIEVDEADFDAETKFLEEEIYHRPSEAVIRQRHGA